MRVAPFISLGIWTKEENFNEPDEIIYGLGETFRSRILSSGSGSGARWCFDFAEAASGVQSNSAAQSSTQKTRPLHDPNNSEQGVTKDRQIVIGDGCVTRLLLRNTQQEGEC